MPRAVLNDTVLAESPETVVVEGNHYFPPDSVNRRYLDESDHGTFCPWKGSASYLTAKVDGAECANAAWYYPDPKPEAEHIRDHVAFWKDVEIEE